MRGKSLDTSYLKTLYFTVAHAMQAFLAVTACGAIAVPINLRWSVQEAAAALRHVSAGLLFIDAELVQKYASILDERCCIVLGSAAGRNQSAAIASSVQPDSRQAIQLMSAKCGFNLCILSDGLVGRAGPPISCTE